MNAVWIKAFAVWLVILALAIGNGVLRERALVPAFGDVAGTAASGAILCALIVGVTALAGRWFGPQRARHLWAIGAAWLALTLAFEFGFGLARGQAWAEMLRPYTFAGGNLWPLVLLTTLTAPRLVVPRRRAG